MTLIPLDRRNFANNHVEVRPAVDYISASNFFNNFKEIKDEGLVTSGTIGGVRAVGTYSPRVKESSRYFLGDNHPNNVNIGLLNERLSEENVEEYLSASNNLDVLCRNTWQFGIDRIQQKYISTDDNLGKKLTVKNSLYKNYSSYKDVNDYIENPNWSFSNYNCINFFTVGKGDANKTGFSDNVIHTNGIVYPNIFNQYDFSTNDVTVSFWFNPRYKQPGSTNKNNGCIINLPGIMNIYQVRGTEKDLEGKEKTFRIAITLARNTKRDIILTDSDLTNNTNQNLMHTDEKYFVPTISLGVNRFGNEEVVEANSPSLRAIVTKDCLKFNNWHHIVVKLSFKENISVSVFVDKDEIYTTTIFNNTVSRTITRATGPETSVITRLNESLTYLDNFAKRTTNKFICIGNKISFNPSEVEISRPYTETLDKLEEITNMLFTETGEENPYNTKFISVGKERSNPTVAFEDINNIFSSVRETSESLEGEIHDIRIYNSILSQKKIEENYKQGVTNIEDEKLAGLIFYVPTYFIPDNLRKKTYLNAARNISDRVTSTCFNFVTNPYYFNNCGGHQVSSELFLLEWIRNTRPNIILGNRINNDYKIENIEDLTNTNDISNSAWTLSKNGTPYHEIYLSQSLSSKYFLMQSYSHVYNNNLIMPCDNGLQSQNFNIIKTNFSSGIVTSSYMFDTKNGYFDYSQVFIDNSFVQDKENDDYPLSKSYTNTSNTFREVTERATERTFLRDGTMEVTNKLHRDKLFNLSNLQYHAKEYSYDWFNTGASNFFVDYFGNFHRDSNPITRRYSNGKIDNTGNFIGESDIFNNSYTGVHIQKVFPLYKETQDPVEFHSIIFSISNQLYNRKIRKETFSIKDYDLFGTANTININLKESGRGILYRADAETKHAEWNHVGHIFYSEGICTVLHPSLYNFGKTNFRAKFLGENAVYVNEINIPVEAGFHNRSHNSSYISDLVASESSYETNHKFVYVTDINLHDESLNIVARAKLAQPVVKRETDNIVFRLKMDY